MPDDVVTMEKIVALCKRRGFIFQSSEIYGGLASTYDYGHYGVLLKNNVKDEWWRAVIQERDDMVALDAAILMHPRTWEASGPPRRASPTRSCSAWASARGAGARTTSRARAGGRAPRAPSAAASSAEPREFNLMFETFMGPVRDDAARIFLRPETAQGIFVNFKNVLQFSRKKPPFGIAQIGKAFRNEITPGNFIFRTREFEQMEIEFFVPPAEARDVAPALDGRAHALVHRPRASGRTTCSSASTAPTSSRTTRPATSDIEYLFPMGWSELEGIANRTDFDLTPAREVLGREPRVLRHRDGRALRPVRDRALRRRRPRRRSPSWSTPTTRRRSRAASARCCACTRASRR